MTVRESIDPRGPVASVLPPLFAICILMQGCSSPSPSGTVLYAQGHVVNVLEGTPPDPGSWVDLKGFRAGFEAGSTRSVDSIGEFVSFNGVGYARSTAALDQGQMMTGSRVLTNGAVFLPKHASPSFSLTVEEPVALAELVASMESRAGGPVCYVGVLEFDPLNATAISRAPIYGDYIFDSTEAYYLEPPTETRLVHAAIMGCAADLERCDVPGLDAVLYANPSEPTGGITSHTHALEIAQRVGSVSEVVSGDAVQVHHVFSRSIVVGGTVEVYQIEAIRPITVGG